MYYTQREKEELEKKKLEHKKYLESMREQEEYEEEQERAKNKREMERIYQLKQQAKADKRYWKKYDKEISDKKRQLDYEKEMNELKRLRRTPYLDKREPTGAEAGQMALQRQKETAILNAKMKKQQTEKHEAFKESERIRVAKQQEERERIRLEEAENPSFKKENSGDAYAYEAYGIQKKSLSELFNKKPY